MFFSNNYIEAETPSAQAQQHAQQQQRRLQQCSSEENDILRELLLDGDFASPRHFALTPSKPSSSSSATSTMSGNSATPAKRHHVEISIPQICFDSSTLLRSTPSLLNRSLCMFPSSSPLSHQQHQQHQTQHQHHQLQPPLLLSSASSSSSAPAAPSGFNSLISPPRVFIQDYAHYPRPFFHDSSNGQSLSSSSGGLDADIHDIKQQPQPLQQQQQQQMLPLQMSLPTRGISSVFHSTPTRLPQPPMLVMPPFKNKKAKLVVASHQGISTPIRSSNNSSDTTKNISLNSVSPERKQQLRCSYPDCPNLRRSAGFCNRHSGKVCSVPDCHKSALSRGKCPEHGGGSRCKKDGCFKFAQTRGLCKSHGGGRLCTISSCEKNAHQNRLCRSHGGGKRCDYHGCPKWAQRSGFCCAHTKSGPAGSHASSSLPSQLQLSSRSTESSPVGAALPMPSPTTMMMSQHHILSMLP